MIEVAERIGHWLRDGGIYAFFGGACVIIFILYSKVQSEHSARLEDAGRSNAAISSEKDAHRATAMLMLPALSRVQSVLEEFTHHQRGLHGAKSTRRPGAGSPASLGVGDREGKAGG